MDDEKNSSIDKDGKNNSRFEKGIFFITLEEYTEIFSVTTVALLKKD
jgi:hypothetical protein